MAGINALNIDPRQVEDKLERRWIVGTSGHVCAVTIAYDNPGRLARLLSSLNNQNDALCGLVVIDNSDKRYSRENKTAFDSNACHYVFSRYYKTRNNIGSAGGFRTGMEIAHRNGFEWVWLLDQDGLVSSGCLTELLKHAKQGAILCPNVFDIERNFSFPMAYAVNFLGGLYPATWCLTDCQVRTFGTHGALISRKSLDTIGYYDDLLFFVGSEDLEYGFRATKAGLRIALVEKAEVLHPQPRVRTKFMAVLPRTLLGVPSAHERMMYVNTRSAGAFAQTYFESKRLKWWQFGISLVYSFCLVLCEKITSDSRISLKKTLRLWLLCLACSLKKEWPYGSVIELCRSVLR